MQSVVEDLKKKFVVARNPRKARALVLTAHSNPFSFSVPRHFALQQKNIRALWKVSAFETGFCAHKPRMSTLLTFVLDLPTAARRLCRGL